MRPITGGLAVVLATVFSSFASAQPAAFGWTSYANSQSNPVRLYRDPESKLITKLIPENGNSMVAKKVNYILDILKHKVDNYYQPAPQTAKELSGDCEDHAILLYAWLKQNGYDPRLVVGKVGKVKGYNNGVPHLLFSKYISGKKEGQYVYHAWVEVNGSDGIPIILETTSGDSGTNKEFEFSYKSIYIEENCGGEIEPELRRLKNKMERFVKEHGNDTIPNDWYLYTRKPPTKKSRSSDFVDLDRFRFPMFPKRIKPSQIHKGYIPFFSK